jgi:hypothetical protein
MAYLKKENSMNPKAEAALEDILAFAPMSGLCVVAEGAENPFGISSVVVTKNSVGGVSNELLVISQMPGGSFKLHEYNRTVGGTVLGQEPREKLKKAGLTVKD